MDLAQEKVNVLVEKQQSIRPGEISALLKSGQIQEEFVYVLFWADWCGFCPRAKFALADFLSNRRSLSTPSLKIFQCTFPTVTELRQHPVIRHPHTPWQEEKLVLTTIPTHLLMRVQYKFPSIFFQDSSLDSGQKLAHWVNMCAHDLSNGSS